MRTALAGALERVGLAAGGYETGGTWEAVEALYARLVRSCGVGSTWGGGGGGGGSRGGGGGGGGGPPPPPGGGGGGGVRAGEGTCREGRGGHTTPAS